MKIAGWNFGLFGDLVMNTTLAKTFKTHNPDSNLIFCVGRKYSAILPLFYNHPCIDGFHVWEGCDDWPTNNDSKYIESGRFDKVYSACPQHKRQDWYKYNHYIEEVHDMNDFPPPVDMQCHLDKWFQTEERSQKLITTSLVSGNDPLGRALDSNQILSLHKDIEKLGYKVVRLDTKQCPTLENDYPASKLSLLDAVKLLLTSKLHLTVDTSYSWIGSSYSHPVLSLHGINYPDMDIEHVKSHVPFNPNARAIISNSVKEIKNQSIIDVIKSF